MQVLGEQTASALLERLPMQINFWDVGGHGGSMYAAAKTRQCCLKITASDSRYEYAGKTCVWHAKCTAASPEVQVWPV